MSDPVTADKRDRPRDSPFPGADHPERLEPIFDDLDANQAVRERAYEIATVAESTMWVVGTSRSTVAASAVYVAGLIEADAEQSYSQTAVADASEASIAAISTNWQDLRAVYRDHR